MKSISSHLIFLIILIWKSIQIRFSRHCLMEGRIKYSNHWNIRHQFLTCTDSDQISWIMKRCELIALLNLCKHLLIQYYRLCKLLASMYHTMSYRIDFAETCPCLVSDISWAAFISSSGCLLRFRKEDRIRSSVNTGTVLSVTE